MTKFAVDVIPGAEYATVTLVANGTIVTRALSHDILHGITRAAVLRLARDLKERRKPPLTLVRRGLVLMRDEPRVVARHVELGARCATPRQAERQLAGA